MKVLNRNKKTTPNSQKSLVLKSAEFLMASTFPLLLNVQACKVLSFKLTGTHHSLLGGQ